MSSQSLKDTQEWVSQVVETNGWSVILDWASGNPKYTYQEYMEFTDDGKMIVTSNYFRPNQEAMVYVYSVPVKELRSIIYESVEEGIKVKFVAKTTDDDNGKIKCWFNPEINKEPPSTVSSFYLHFRKDFEKEEMPARFRKAITHLIELHGGDPIKDVF